MSGGSAHSARVYIYIYIRFALACAFSLEVYRGCVVARYIFKWFFVFRVLIWQKVFVIYRFRPLWLSRCVSGEGLVRSRWLALLGLLRGDFGASFFPYINIFCELPIARPRRPYVIDLFCWTGWYYWTQVCSLQTCVSDVQEDRVPL